MEFHCVVRGVYLAIIANLSENRVAQLVYGHIMPPISVAYLVIGTTSKAYMHMQDVVTMVGCRMKNSHSTTRYVRLYGEIAQYYLFFLGKMLGTRYGPVGTQFL